MSMLIASLQISLHFASAMKNHTLIVHTHSTQLQNFRKLIDSSLQDAAAVMNAKKCDKFTLQNWLETYFLAL